MNKILILLICLIFLPVFLNAQLGPEDTFAFAKIRIKNTDHSGYTGKIKMIGERRGITYTANLTKGYAKVKLPFDDTYTIYCEGHKNRKKLKIGDFPYVTFDYNSYIYRFALINFLYQKPGGSPLAGETLWAKGIHHDTSYTAITDSKGRASMMVPFEDAYSMSVKYRPDFQVVRAREMGQPYTIINVQLVWKGSEQTEREWVHSDSLKKIYEKNQEAWRKKRAEEKKVDSIHNAVLLLSDKTRYYEKFLKLKNSIVIDFRKEPVPFSKTEVMQDFEINLKNNEVNYENLGWSGKSSDCNAGTISKEAKAKFLAHIKFFRRLCGVSENVVFDDNLNKNCQKCAMMCRANSTIDHHPPADWKCYVPEGAAACGYSNLSLGSIDYPLGHISMYIDDFGVDNYSVGHRRWIINPNANKMGIGATLSGTALAVFPDYSCPRNSDTRDGFVAWPPRGYVPQQLIFDRWSFGVEDGVFKNAKVEMLDSDGRKIKLKTLKLSGGCGVPTIVWEPQTGKLKKGDRYEVILSNVKIHGKRYLYQYWVEVI
jgi:hypothetical protein